MNDLDDVTSLAITKLGDKFWHYNSIAKNWHRIRLKGGDCFAI